MGIALQAAVSRRDVLRRARNGCFCHDRVGLRGLIHGLEFQPLVVNPEIGWLQVFGVAFVFVGAVGGLGGRSLPAEQGSSEGQRLDSLIGRIRSSSLLFLVGRRAARAQKSPHHHHDDGEGPHGNDDDNDQDVIFTVASNP